MPHRLCSYGALNPTTINHQAKQKHMVQTDRMRAEIDGAGVEPNSAFIAGGAAEERVRRGVAISVQASRYAANFFFSCMDECVTPRGLKCQVHGAFFVFRFGGANICTGEICNAIYISSERYNFPSSERRCLQTTLRLSRATLCVSPKENTS